MDKGSAVVLGLLGVVAAMAAVLLYESNRLSRGYMVNDPLLLDGYGPAIGMGLVATTSMAISVLSLVVVRRRRQSSDG